MTTARALYVVYLDAYAATAAGIPLPAPAWSVGDDVSPERIALAWATATGVEDARSVITCGPDSVTTSIRPAMSFATFCDDMRKALAGADVDADGAVDHEALAVKFPWLAAALAAVTGPRHRILVATATCARANAIREALSRHPVKWNRRDAIGTLPSGAKVAVDVFSADANLVRYAGSEWSAVLFDPDGPEVNPDVRTCLLSCVRHGGTCDPLPETCRAPTGCTIDPGATLVTPESLWQAHRTAAGGRSTISGAPLPETLSACPAGPQATHYAMACYVAARHGQDPASVPIPGGVDPRDARTLRALMAQFAVTDGDSATPPASEAQ